MIRWRPERDEIDEADLASVGGLDAVVHLAGAGIADKRWSAARRNEILESRTSSTALLARALPQMSHPPRVVASGSAIGIYGSRGDEILTEDSPPGRDFLADVCRQWEDAAQPLESAGILVPRLRTGIVMSARGGALKKQLPLFRAGLGGRLGSGHQWTSPISLRDQVRAILFLLESDLTGPVNLTSPEPVTNRDFTARLAAAVHRPGRATVPPFALRLALGSDLTNDALLASQRVLPSRLLDAGFVFDDATLDAVLASALAA